MSKGIKIKSFPRILVIGDLILDKYWEGVSARLSPEAPIPVFDFIKETSVPGGAGNVARNIAAFDGFCTLMGGLGNDAAAVEFKQHFNSSSVNLKIIQADAFQSIVKTRLIAGGQHIVRVDFDLLGQVVDQEELQDHFNEELEGHDLVLLSDYGKGAMSDAFVEHVITQSNKAGLRVIIDPKGGCFRKYSNAFLITPNLSEFELIMGPSKNKEELVEKAQNLRFDLRLDYLVITLGPKGMVIVGDDLAEFFPATAREVYDVSGAGDTVIAVIASELASGRDINTAIGTANKAAGIVVGKPGSSTVHRAELNVYENKEANALSEDDIFHVIEWAKREGLKVVMTNGCFDVIHRGHVEYLREAKSMGGLLIVAINSDDSIKELKGNSRPLNSFDDRASVLLALSSVDYVIGFNEKTPKKLYEKFLPDVLVKGGDYSLDEIVGGDEVIANGGEVRIVEFVDGFSTTSLVNKIIKSV